MLRHSFENHLRNEDELTRVPWIREQLESWFPEARIEFLPKEKGAQRYGYDVVVSFDDGGTYFVELKVRQRAYTDDVLLQIEESFPAEGDDVWRDSWALSPKKSTHLACFWFGKKRVAKLFDTQTLRTALVRNLDNWIERYELPLIRSRTDDGHSWESLCVAIPMKVLRNALLEVSNW